MASNPPVLDLNTWEPWLLSIGLTAPFRVEPRAGGQNNRSYRLETGEGQVFIKHYYAPARLQTEFAFLQSLHQEGIGSVPRAIAKKPELNLAVYDFVEGAPIEARGVEAGVGAAARFLGAIQKARGHHQLPSSDSAVEPATYLAGVERRWQSCERELGSNSALRLYLQDRLRPAWEARANEVIPPALESSRLILSPSDFGFHNVLVRPSGELCFLDFEYAGLDDPAKTICDFYCQPRVPVPTSTLGAFQTFIAPVDRGRIQWMWRLTLLKWALLLLNPFLSQNRDRKRFSKVTLPKEEEQIYKAEQIFAREEAFLDELEGRLS